MRIQSHRGPVKGYMAHAAPKRQLAIQEAVLALMISVLT